MRARSDSVACAVFLMTLCLNGSPASAQPGAGPAIGVDRIRAILTEQAHWTMYWSSVSPAPRPPASAASGAIEFTRHGDTIRAHLSIPALSRECEFEVVVKDRGFSYPGCQGPQNALVRSPDREITYDPDDREYPYQGNRGVYLVLVSAPVTEARGGWAATL